MLLSTSTFFDSANTEPKWCRCLPSHLASVAHADERINDVRAQPRVDGAGSKTPIAAARSPPRHITRHHMLLGCCAAYCLLLLTQHGIDIVASIHRLQVLRRDIGHTGKPRNRRNDGVLQCVVEAR